MIQFAQKLINNSDSQITILDVADQIKNNSEIKEKLRSIEQKVPNHINVLNGKKIDKEFLNEQNLMIISIDSWKKLVDSKSLWLSSIPSTLIIKDND
ncbi:MAG: hypothetical protein WBF83_02215 [Moheibacter sp.]